MARLSVFSVVAFAVPVVVYISVFLIILELGRGGPARRPLAADSSVEDVAKRLWETAKERGAEAAQVVMESRRLGRRSMQPKQQHHPRVISVGPWGGPGGQPFHMRGSSVPRLRAIMVYHSNASIHALACEYSIAGDDEDDATGEQRGRIAGPWGIPFSAGSRSVRATIELSAGEYLTAVEGTTGHVGGGVGPGGGVVVVTSLTFRSSRGKTYGPYGGSGTGTATPFSVPAASGCIVGFWGRSGGLLHAIGVYIKPCAPTISYDDYPYLETGMKVTVSNKTFVFP